MNLKMLETVNASWGDVNQTGNHQMNESKCNESDARRCVKQLHPRSSNGWSKSETLDARRGAYADRCWSLECASRGRSGLVCVCVHVSVSVYYITLLHSQRSCDILSPWQFPLSSAPRSPLVEQESLGCRHCDEMHRGSMSVEIHGNHVVPRSIQPESALSCPLNFLEGAVLAHVEGHPRMN